MFNKIKNIQPHIFFIYTAVFFIIVINIVTPPLQAPDEFNHFYRAYQIADGQFLPNKVDKRLGGEMPNCINEFVNSYYNVSFELKKNVTLTDLKNSFKIKFNNDTTVFKDFPNTSYYSPISYAPQALAVFITKQLGCTIGTMYYTGKFFIILIWLISMFFVIKIVPVYKWLFTLLCLLPMNIYVTSSFSADSVTNILCFLFIALILKYTFSLQQLTYKHLLLLVLIILLIALAKLVYVGLVLMFFIIPFSKYKSKTQYFIFVGSLLLTAILASSFWSGIVMQNYIPYSAYDVNHRDLVGLSDYANYYQQKAYILSHGAYFLKVIYHSLFNHSYNYLCGYIGAFGNSDIPTPTWLLWLSYILIIYFVLFEKNEFKVTIKQQIILFSAAFCAFFLLLLSQHLTWDAVGEGVVDLLQGRYLIPIFPVLFLAFGNYKFKFKINNGLLISVLVTVLYVVSTYLIVNRYYIKSYKQKIEFTCDAESVNEKSLFKTSNPNILLNEGYLTSNLMARSGKSSMLLTQQSAFGFTYRFNNLNFGDLIEISVWQKGEGATLVLTSDSGVCKKIYAPNNHVVYYDKNGWGKINMQFLMQDSCKNSSAAFYVWNPTKNNIYVDDLSFSLTKF